MGHYGCNDLLSILSSVYSAFFNNNDDDDNNNNNNINNNNNNNTLYLKRVARNSYRNY